MEEKIEYRVIPVTRWIVTRYRETFSEDGKGSTGSSCERGEFQSDKLAAEIAHGLAIADRVMGANVTVTDYSKPTGIMKSQSGSANTKDYPGTQVWS